MPAHSLAVRMRGAQFAGHCGLLIIGLGICGSTGATQPDTQHYSGTAYASSDGRVAYTEEHFVFDDQGVPSRLVLYHCPSGQPFARKWVRDVQGAQAPDFDLIDARTGYREGVRGKPGQREIYVKADQNATLHSAPLDDRANAVIDAGFDAYVREHWNSLSTTTKAPIAFAIPSRLGYVELKLDDAKTDAPSTDSLRHLRLSMDAWYSFAAPSIALTYENSDRRLLRFEGLSDIRDAAGKSQRVRIEFPRSAVLAAPTPQQIQQAATLPLVTRCPA